jgi:hypothetical protein
LSIQRHSKISPNWDFWFEKINHLATLASGKTDQQEALQMLMAEQMRKC